MGEVINVAVTWSSFSPTTARVPRGGTVMWSWNSCNDGQYGGGGCNTHNITFNDPALGASASQSQGTWARQFNTAGTYGYHCTVHGTATSGMRGSVVVE